MKWAALACCLALAGCNKGDDGKSGQVPADEGPPPIEQAEAARGVTACEQYKAAVCACAEKTESPDHDRECKLADSRIEALKMQLDVLAAKDQIAGQDRRVVQAEARKVIKGCLEDTAKLADCPR